MSGLNIDDIIHQQVDSVVRRVNNGGGAYQEEIREVQVASENLLKIRRRLGLGELTSNLTPNTGKPQFLLGFQRTPGSREQVVLKVYGSVRPGEGLTQVVLTKGGAPVIPTRLYGNSPVSWLLMDRVKGRDLTEVIAKGDSTLVNETRRIASAMEPFHELAPREYPGVQSLEDAILRHLDAVVAPLKDHGYETPMDWREHAVTTYNAGQKVGLHNDLFSGNVFVGENSQLYILDSAADHCVGDPAFDAARWIARSVSNLNPKEMWSAKRALTRSWLDGEPGLDPTILDQMIAVELLMQAGVVEIVKDEKGLPSVERDSKTLKLLDLYHLSRGLDASLSSSGDSCLEQSNAPETLI